MSALISRRIFFRRTIGGAVLLCSGSQLAFGEDMAKVDENGAQATGLGYKHDGASVDTAKFARYEAGQTCGNCQLYTGAAGSEWGPCGIFPGKAVNANGWCSAWVKKAG